jgi:NAD(P)-dependent dehydrogenase (short-subunit alcohol dehydrogenase family)
MTSPRTAIRSADHGGPVALVTGASSGIGEASARALAAAGYRVVLAARRADELARVVKAIIEAGGQAIAAPTDLAEPDETSTLVAATVDTFGRLDVLLNNAGYGPAAAVEQLDRDALRHAFDVNLLGALQLVGEATPVMRAQGGGRIIQMGSLGARVPAPLAIPYSATKAGLDIATRGLRLELEPFGIDVVLIVPGFVDTPTFDNSRAASETLRADPDNPYRERMVELDDFARSNQKNAIPPEAVARLVVRAATTKRPRPTYYAPASARLQSAAFAWLPERLAHSILRRVYAGR